MMPSPVLVLEGAGDAHLGAERVGVVDLETDDLALRIDALERRIGRIRADADGFPVLGFGGGQGGEQSDGRREEWFASACLYSSSARLTH